jgi:PDZ domain-containing protein
VVELRLTAFAQPAPTSCPRDARQVGFRAAQNGVCVADERRRKLRNLLIRLAPLAVVVGILAFWPMPYYVYGPWTADDLNRVVHVQGHTPSPGVLYDTSILILPGRPASYLAGKLLPGFEIVPRTDLAPPSMSDLDMLRYMYVSQEAGKRSAEIVAARAAGLPLEVRKHLVIARLNPARHAPQCFHVGDQVVSVNGRPIETLGTLVQAADGRPVGASFTVAVLRREAPVTLHCTTVRLQGRPRFGVNLSEYDELVKLPIDVTYTLPFYQSGGSTGLMFALEIYKTLTGTDLNHGVKVAGTGVIDDNGTVTPIVGARQKIITAREAGATIFLVPRRNYMDVRSVKDIRVIPVDSFNEAVNWLSWRLYGCPHAPDDIKTLTGIGFADLPIGDAEYNGLPLPAGILRLDYGHAACNLIRFWYFWQHRTQPLHVRFTRGSLREATLRQQHGVVTLEAIDNAGRRYSKVLTRAPDALVAYFISTRPGVALWYSPTTYDYIGFDANRISFYHAQPPPGNGTPPPPRR